MLPETAPDQAESMDDIIDDLDRIVMPEWPIGNIRAGLRFFPSGVSPVSVLGSL